MSGTPRVGFVGLGDWGTGRARDVDGLGGTVVAGVDVVPERREQFGSEFDAATYDDAESLLESEPVDGLVIGTPNAYHADAAIAALERGVSAYVAKPMADDLENAEAMVRAERESDAFGFVGYNSRYAFAPKVFKGYYDRGRFGQVTHVEAHMLCRRAALPGTWFTSEELAGGGGLLDLGVHALDLVFHLLDFPEVVEVSAKTRTDLGHREDYVRPNGNSTKWSDESGGFDVDDSATALIRTADGPTIALENSSAVNREHDWNIHFRGTEAGARFEIGHGKTLHLNETSTLGHEHYVNSELTGDLDPNSHQGALSDYLDALETGDTPGTCGFDEAIYTMRVIDAIYRSSDRDKAVQVELTTEADLLRA